MINDVVLSFRLMQDPLTYADRSESNPFTSFFFFYLFLVFFFIFVASIFEKKQKRKNKGREKKKGKNLSDPMN